MRAILHIGTEKTGTTSIQSFLALNRPLFRQRSFFFPWSPGTHNHVKLGVYAPDDHKRDDLRVAQNIATNEDLNHFRNSFANELKKEVSAAGCETVLFSNEHCSSRLLSISEVERLRDLLATIFSSVRIIIYLRRQDEFLLSSYSTMVKHGHVNTLERPNPQAASQRYDYDQILQRWKQVFGRENITCRLHTRDRLVAGNVVADFIETAGLPTDLNYEQPKRENESLDVEGLEFLRQLNQYVPFIKDGKIFAERGDLVSYLEQLSTGSRPIMEPAKLAEFMELFRDSNARVAGEFFGGPLHLSGDPLFGEPSVDPTRRPIEPLSAEKAFEIFAELWIRKERHVSALRAKLAAQAKS